MYVVVMSGCKMVTDVKTSCDPTKDCEQTCAAQGPPLEILTAELSQCPPNKNYFKEDQGGTKSETWLTFDQIALGWRDAGLKEKDIEVAVSALIIAGGECSPPTAVDSKFPTATCVVAGTKGSDSKGGFGTNPYQLDSAIPKIGSFFLMKSGGQAPTWKNKAGEDQTLDINNPCQAAIASTQLFMTQNHTPKWSTVQGLSPSCPSCDGGTVLGWPSNGMCDGAHPTYKVAPKFNPRPAGSGTDSFAGKTLCNFIGPFCHHDNTGPGYVWDSDDSDRTVGAPPFPCYYYQAFLGHLDPNGFAAGTWHPECTDTTPCPCYPNHDCNKPDLSAITSKIKTLTPKAVPKWGTLLDQYVRLEPKSLAIFGSYGKPSRASPNPELCEKLFKPLAEMAARGYCSCGVGRVRISILSRTEGSAAASHVCANQKSHHSA